MENQAEIIASREQSSIVSTWTEYLCLEPISTVRYRLFTGRYELLAELSAFYNEETEEYELPEEIDGKSVQGFDDEYVVGGELQYFDDEHAVEFSSPDELDVAEWLGDSRWSVLATVQEVRIKLHALLSAPH